MSVRFFQIGFNKCGTTSLFKLFTRSGVPALKLSGQRSSLVAGRDPFFWNAQVRIDKNLRLGKKPLAGFGDVHAFFDMEFTSTDHEIQNFRRFKELYAAYPDAKFLLNVRDKYEWARSRAGHSKGDYLNRAMQRYNVPGIDIMNMWLADYERHNQDVRLFFADKPAQFMEFDIDTGDVEDVIAFAAPDFALNRKHWANLNSRRASRNEVAGRLFDLMFAPPELAAREDQRQVIAFPQRAQPLPQTHNKKRA